MTTSFRQLNDGWNADPNVPDAAVHVDGRDVVLTFLANPYRFPRFAKYQPLRLRFTNARRYHLDGTNDEGWYRGQCRFSGEAPAWGEFYEVSGDLKLEQCPSDWNMIKDDGPAGRHFLFYFRDETFECEADGWTLEE